ncbi:hypothetical protein ACLOJK_027874 [Asimina triloba]
MGLPFVLVTVAACLSSAARRCARLPSIACSSPWKKISSAAMDGEDDGAPKFGAPAVCWRRVARERGRDVSASRTYRLQLQGYRSTNRERRKSPSTATVASRVAAARRKEIVSSSRGHRRTALPSPSSSSRLLPLRQVTVGKVSHLPVSILLYSGRRPPLDEPLSSVVSILLCFGRHPPLDEPLSSARDLRPQPPSSLSRPLLPLLSSSARPSSLSPRISPSPPPSASLRPVPPPAPPPAPPPLFLLLPPPPSALSRLLLPLLSSSASLRPLLPLFCPVPCSLRSPRFE